MIYDLIIIGAGPAGYLGAERASSEGLSTLIIEAKAIGGVCLNEGCIPTKTLLKSGKIADEISEGEKYGVETNGLIFNHKKVVVRKEKIVKGLVSEVEALLKNNKVTIIRGAAHILEKKEEGYTVQVEDQHFTAKRLLIATGSSPIIPPIQGIKQAIEREFVLTNREILNIEKVPDSLVVIGGGVIGMEMASYFNSAGSKVTVIEALDQIGGYADKEIMEILKQQYQKKGMEFRLNTRVIEVTQDAVVFEVEGEKETIKVDKVLLSTGRKPNTQNLGLENIGIETEKGAIKVDERGQTNIPGVYAAGDVNGKSMLAHTAYREAEVCINNMVQKKDRMRYHAIPSVIYTNPEVASVGMTEKEAQEKNIEYSMAKVSMFYSGRYLAENEGQKGICKVLVDKQHKYIIGVHMLGNLSSEIIYGAGLMIENQMRVEDIKQLVFPHPTVAEIIREAIFQL